MKKMKLAVMALIASATSLTAQTYELVVLDADGTTESGAYGVNNMGYVVGYKKAVNGTLIPCMWTPYRGYIELPKPATTSAPDAIAYAVNDFFDVVGTYGVPGSPPHRITAGTAVSWEWNGNTFAPSAFAGDGTGAHDINNNDEAGCFQSGYEYAFMYDVWFDTQHNAPYLRFASCMGISDTGDMVGYHYSYYNGTFIPTYYRKEQNGTYTVPSSEAAFAGLGSAGCYDINTNKVAVGGASSGGFVWLPETGNVKLLGPGTTCFAINNLDVIVGTSNNLACTWIKGTNGSYKFTDLNKLVTATAGIVLEKSFRINDDGQIVGQCLNTNTGVRSAFMLTPAKRAPRYLKKAPNRQLEFGWQTIEGHTYALRFSEDLKVWESYPDLYYADTTTNINVFFPIDDATKIFIDVLDLTP